MKTKYLYLAALALLVCFTSCKNEEPFDTQDANDYPQILIPYETQSGTIELSCADPNTPLYDSVVVTPSRYTTVNWYLDNQLVYTGTKINMCFPTGKYALVIEAVTDAGKRTERTGTLTVGVSATAPYYVTPVTGLHVVPGTEVTLNGQNMNKVARVRLSKDVFANEEVCSVAPSEKTDGQIKFTLPEMEDGLYYLRFVDEEENVHGSGTIGVHNGVFALSGYDVFTPLTQWVIEGVNLHNAVCVKVDSVEIINLTVTSKSITLIAPALNPGEYKLTIRNSDGSYVKFGTEIDAPTETITRATAAETELWTGPAPLTWKEPITITKEMLTPVAENAVISLYWEKLPTDDEHYFDPEKGEMNYYWKIEVEPAWWTKAIVPGVDVNDETPNPFTFVYDATAIGLVEEQGAMLIVGWGLNITKITYK